MIPVQEYQMICPTGMQKLFPKISNYLFGQLFTNDTYSVDEPVASESMHVFTLRFFRAAQAHAL